MGCPSRTIIGLSPWDPQEGKEFRNSYVRSAKLFEKKIYLDENDASSLERPLIGALTVTDNLKNSSRKVTTYFRYGTDS